MPTRLRLSCRALLIVALVTPDFDSAGQQASHQLSPALPTVAPPRHGASVTLGRVHLMLCVCRVDRSGVSCCCLYATYRLRVDSLSLCSGPGISAPPTSPEIQVQEVLRDFKAPFLYRSYYGPRPTGVFWSSAILPSVCPMAQLPRLDCCLATAGHQRCADCGPVRGRT